MVHYREFEHNHAAKSASKLEDLIRASLNTVAASGFAKWETIEDRVMPLADGSGMELVLNRVADLQSAVFGEMCLVHQNAMQALLELNSSKQKLSALTVAEIYDLTEKAAPAGSRYVKGLTYFLSISNHLFFLRTQSLTYDHLEKYIEWLIIQGGAGLAAGTASFKSKFDKSVFAGDIGDVQALRVSGPSFPQMNITPTTQKETKELATTKKVADRFVQFEKAFQVVEALLGPGEAKELAESLGPKERLVVDASVKVKGSRTEESKKKLSDIAKQLDSMTDGKVGVEGKDGKISDEDIILRTKMPFSRESENSSLLEFYNVADQLQVVYNRFVADGKITA